MSRQTFTILALGCLLGGLSNQVAWGQFRGFGGSRGGDDDRSRDEMRRRFEEMRSRYSSGSDRDRDEMRRRFEEMRSRGGFSGFGGSRGGDDGDRSRGGFSGWGGNRGGDDGDRSRGGFSGFGSSRGGDDRSRSGDSRSRSRDPNQPAPYLPTPQAPITVELPGNFVEGDSDGDGQITLLEWRQWKPQEIGRFMAMDSNGDGFLTAREVIIAENFPNETATGVSANNYASASPSNSPTPSAAPVGRDAEGNPSGAGTGEKPSAAEARYVFRALDKSPTDGTLTAEEWEKSKSIREGFTNAGITLKVPADLDSFLSQYPPNRIVPRLRLPSN